MNQMERDLGHSARKAVVVTLSVVGTLIVCAVVGTLVFASGSQKAATSFNQDVGQALGATGNTGASSPSSTTSPPVTAPTPNYVGMSVWEGENAPSIDHGWTVSGANETCNGGATDYVVSQTPAAGTIETADGLGIFANVVLVGSCP